MENIVSKQLSEDLVECLKSYLTPIQKQVLLLRINKVTLQNIANSLNLSRERVRQIQFKAKAIIFNSLNDLLSFKELKSQTEVEICRRESSKYSEVGLSVLIRPVHDLELTVRSANVLKHLGLKKGLDPMTIGYLIQMTERELLNEKNFGRVSLKNVKEELSKYGLNLNMKICLYEVGG